MRFIYTLTNLISKKIYVGQTGNPDRRKSDHFYAARKGSDYPLYRSMRKHGVANFEFSILEECEDVVCDLREQYWVAHFDSFNPEKGYNLTSGGSYGRLIAEETKQKLREMFSGEKNPMFGKRNDGAIAANMGNKYFQGRKHPGRSEMNRSQTGEKNPNFGRRGTSSHKSKLTMRQLEEIRTLFLTTKLSNQKIGEIFGVSKQTIMRVRNGLHRRQDVSSVRQQSHRFPR